jgi:hypothetical protein
MRNILGKTLFKTAIKQVVISQILVSNECINFFNRKTKTLSKTIVIRHYQSTSQIIQKEWLCWHGFQNDEELPFRIERRIP